MENIADNLYCSSACQPDYKITGASSFCSSTSTYSVQGVASGSTVTWSASPSGYVTINPQTGSSTTLTKQGDGKITLTATISPCNQVITLPVTVGAPYAPISSQSGACSNGYQTWQLTANSSYGSNWHWTVDHLNTNSDIYIDNPYSSTTFVDVKGGGTVKLTYTGLCGVAKTDGVTLFSNCPPGFTVTPNPANSYITIGSINTHSPDQGKTASLIYAIKITDGLGTIRKTYQYKVGIATTKISTADLNAGVYAVSVYDGHQWSNNPLIIKR